MFNPKFTVSPQILNNITNIELLKERLEKAPLLPKQELSFRKRAAIRMAQSSTGIEGNILNEGEVEKVFLGKATQAPPKDELEVKNYQKAIAFINNESEKTKNLNSSIILKTHQILMENLLLKEKTGRFRTGPVYVVNAYKTHDEVVYTAPKPALVPQLVKNLAVWINATQKESLSPIIQAGIVHHELAAIHPFSDGNGRLARLITMLFLYTNGYGIKRIYTLDSYYNQDGTAYYKAIHSGKNYQESQRSNLTPWLAYFTSGFLWELSRISDQVSTLKTGSDAKKTVFLEKNLLRILDFAVSLGRITSAEAADILGASKRTAQLKLKLLTKQKLLKKIGQGPNTYFAPIIAKQNR